MKVLFSHVHTLGSTQCLFTLMGFPLMSWCGFKLLIRWAAGRDVTGLTALRKSHFGDELSKYHLFVALGTGELCPAEGSVCGGRWWERKPEWICLKRSKKQLEHFLLEVVEWDVWHHLTAYIDGFAMTLTDVGYFLSALYFLLTNRSIKWPKKE